jgi:hypothetical protein
MSKGIRVSEKHGVNPSITICPICGKETGIALLGKLKGDKEAPMRMLSDPCDDCVSKLGDDKIYILAINDQGYNTKGIIIERSALNIPVKGYMTFMKENEFDKVFKH